MKPNYKCASEIFYKYAKWKRRFVWFPCVSARSYKRIWLTYAYYGVRQLYLPSAIPTLDTKEIHWLTEKEYCWLSLINVIK